MYNGQAVDTKKATEVAFFAALDSVQQQNEARVKTLV